MHFVENTMEKKIGYYSDFFLIFSFYATKSITCGEGGAILSNNIKIMEKNQIDF